MNSQTKGSSSERGIALVIALIAILVLGVLATAVMFSSQTQTWASLNYRLATQSRYAAEAGVQRTMNWLSNNYTAPASFGSYNTNANPVQYSSSAVVLSAMSGVSSNYPDSTVASAYNTALSNQSVSGLANTTFSTYATLLRMTPTPGISWLSGSGGVVQTWQITSVGNIGGSRNAAVQVVATYERTSTTIFPYAVAATGTGCKAIDFGGTDGTDSYNSNNGPYGGTNVQASGGNLGSNGNVTLGTGANIEGTISGVNTTVGACPDGITSSGTYSGTSTLSSNLNFPAPWNCGSTTPCYPSPLPPTTSQSLPDNGSKSAPSCGTISGCTANGTANIYLNGSSTATTASVYDLAPGSYGNLTINGNAVVHLSAGTYDINSLNLPNNAQLVIDSGPVVLDVAGQGYSSTNTVINSGGNSGWNLCSGGVTGNPGTYTSTTCGASKTVFSGVPANLQIVYAGSATIATTGAPLSSLIYAPNAAVNETGAAVGMYGAVICKTFTEGSKAPFHYDNALSKSAVQVGNFRPLGFSWSKF